jgi:hypothetical protein
MYTHRCPANPHTSRYIYDGYIAFEHTQPDPQNVLRYFLLIDIFRKQAHEKKYELPEVPVFRPSTFPLDEHILNCFWLSGFYEIRIERRRGSITWFSDIF